MARIIFTLALAVVCFLFTLNQFLRGRLTQRIGGYLSLGIVAVIGASFFFTSWQFGLLLIGLSFVFVAISSLFAGRLAYRLLGYRTGFERRDDSLVSFTSGRTSFSDLMESIQQRRDATQKRLLKIARGRKVADVLERHSVTADELFEMHEYLGRANLYDISFAIINSPAELEILIKFHREDKPPIEAHTVFRHFQ